MTISTKTHLSLKQAQQAFGVAHMALHLWRQGTATKDPLPVEIDAEDKKKVKPRVWLRISTLKQWAKKNGVEFAVLPEKLAGKELPKPGPKPKVRAKPSKRARTKH